MQNGRGGEKKSVINLKLSSQGGVNVDLPGDDHGVGLQQDLVRLHRALQLDLHDDDVAHPGAGVQRRQDARRIPQTLYANWLW